MRTVVKTDEVSHLWAHQSQPAARNSQGNHSFEGRTIKSYWASIGRLAETPSGETVAVLSARRYSVTTGSHQSRVRWSVDHLRRVWVPDWVSTQKQEVRDLDEVISGRLRDASEAKNKISRAKRWQAYLNAIGNANAYREVFGLALLPVPIDVDAEATLAEIKSRREEEERAKAEANAKAEAKARRKAMASLRRWKAGESVGWEIRALPSHYMRVQGDEIVTTLGAIVPIEHVRRFAPMILRAIEAGETYEASADSPIRFGHYRLDRITAAGTVCVGCHRFDRKEIERIGKLIAQPQPASA